MGSQCQTPSPLPSGQLGFAQLDALATSARALPPHDDIVPFAIALGVLTSIVACLSIAMIAWPLVKGKEARTKHLWTNMTVRWSWSRVPAPMPNGILAISFGFLGESINQLINVGSFPAIAGASDTFQTAAELGLGYSRALVGVPTFCGLWLYCAYSLGTCAYLRLARRHRCEPERRWWIHPILLWLVVWAFPAAVVVFALVVGQIENDRLARAGVALDELRAALSSCDLAAANGVARTWKAKAAMLDDWELFLRSMQVVIIFLAGGVLAISDGLLMIPTLASNRRISASVDIHPRSTAEDAGFRRGLWLLGIKAALFELFIFLSGANSIWAIIIAIKPSTSGTMRRMITRMSTSTSVLIVIAAVYLFTIVRDLDVQAEAAGMRERHAAICPWEAERYRPANRVLDLHQAVWTHLPRPSTSRFGSTDDETSKLPTTPVVVPEDAVLVTRRTDRSSFYEEDLIFTPDPLPAGAVRPSVEESFRLSAPAGRY